MTPRARSVVTAVIAVSLSVGGCTGGPAVEDAAHVPSDEPAIRSEPVEASTADAAAVATQVDAIVSRACNQLEAEGAAGYNETLNNAIEAARSLGADDIVGSIAAACMASFQSARDAVTGSDAAEPRGIRVPIYVEAQVDGCTDEATGRVISLGQAAADAVIRVYLLGPDREILSSKRLTFSNLGQAESREWTVSDLPGGTELCEVELLSAVHADMAR